MSFTPQGTVYGTLLNSNGEWDALRAQMDQPPYKAPPRAPVLYVKPANTWSAHGAAIAVPAHVPQVEVGATIAMVMGLGHKTIAGWLLLNDLSVPHASFFRPPVRFKCLDGFLGIGPALVAPADAGDPAKFKLEVRINGELKQSFDFATLVRPAAQLLEDVSEFMTPQPGDVLMLGCGPSRPLARVGDRIEISAPGFATLTNTLVHEAT